MSARYTPAPWSIERYDEDFVSQNPHYFPDRIIRAGDFGPMVARVQTNPSFVGNNRGRANACLISAAPDLLTVAEATALAMPVLIDMLKRAGLPIGANVAEQMLDAANAAVAKVTSS